MQKHLKLKKYWNNMFIAIYGSGGHAKSIYNLIKNKKKITFFDEKKKFLKIGSEIFSIKGGIKKLINEKNKISHVVIAIGDNEIREKNYKILKKKFKFATLIHPKSNCAYGVKIGDGTVVMPGSLINTDTVIGKNCIINCNSSIDHDCVIKDHTHICPGVIIGGNVTVGKNSWIGLGSKIIQNCVIGDNVFVAAGSVVIKNIKSNSFVKGVPAKYDKKKLAKL
tara:strand:+ start:8914 stop:9582 length:669 start_codon:yes stop_codon:yes gene_type:complete